MSKMIDEIRQQPVALEKTLKGGMRDIERLRATFAGSRPRLILLVARGTSDNAAQFGRYLLEVTTGIPVSLAAPSIFTLYKASLDFRDVLVVALSQSGESTDTNYVIERAQASGARTIGITNEAKSTLARLPERVLLVRAGKERSVAATKTYTGQLLMMYAVAYALGAPIRPDDLRRLPELAEAALRLDRQIGERAGRYTFMTRALVVGRGLNYSNAFEFALKLMETCYVVAERFSSADLLHGPIAMVEHAFPAFLFCPPGVTAQGMRELYARLESLKAETLVITDRGNPADASRAFQIPLDLTYRNRNLPQDVLTPIPYIIPAQLFAARLAEHKGLDPDQPRTLSKVTRTL